MTSLSAKALGDTGPFSEGIEGFKSTMRFKMSIDKGNWARMKHEQTITPYFMDAIQIPGKKTPNHYIIIFRDNIF